jgi:hypothetical protein
MFTAVNLGRVFERVGGKYDIKKFEDFPLHGTV